MQLLPWHMLAGQISNGNTLTGKISNGNMLTGHMPIGLTARARNHPI